MAYGSHKLSKFYFTNLYICLPGCSFSVAEIARLAADWNIPHITYGGNGEFLANKTEFATLTRLSSNLNSFGKFYFEVFRVSFN